MLQLATDYEQAGSAGRESRAPAQLDVLALMRILIRRWRRIAAICAMSVALGVVYMIVATRMYTAEFEILVVPPKASLLSRSDPDVGRIMDPGIVETQVEVLKSDSVALATVRALDLTTDPSVMGKGPSWIQTAFTSVLRKVMPASPKGPSSDNLEQAAVGLLTSNLKVQRVGATYVLQGSYVNPDPVRAGQIANGIANAYMDSQLDARYQASRRAADWLQTRLKKLREETSTAEFAVQRFKTENGIVDTARGLITDQQLSDANMQLGLAHDATSAAKANLDRIQKVLQSSDAVNATVPDALKDEVLSRLRAKYLDLSSQAADLSARFGPTHGAVVSLNNQMRELSKATRDELGRIAESLKSSYESAASKENQVKQDLKAAVGKADTTNKAQVELRDLESAAQTSRSLYDNMLDKLQQTTQEQTSPDDSARVITPAATPDRPSSPKLPVVLGAFLVGGLAAGCGLAVLRELTRNGFKTADDVKSYAGLECIGTLPLVSINRRTARTFSAVAAANKSETVLGSNFVVARYALLAPFSRFTETIRSVKVSIDIARTGREAAITGIVSSVPKEGKTTFSANLALLTAQMGHRTLLIDGDMHNPSLTRTLLPHASRGLIDVLEGRSAIADAMVTDSPTGLVFLPTVVKERKPNSVSLLTSDAMEQLLATARQNFDFVIIDLPPVVPVVDVKAAATMFDNFIFVTEWSRTSRDVVRDALLTSSQVRERIIGVVLNKADVVELRRLESYRGPAYDSYYVESETHDTAA